MFGPICSPAAIEKRPTRGALWALGSRIPKFEETNVTHRSVFDLPFGTRIRSFGRGATTTMLALCSLAGSVELRAESTDDVWQYAVAPYIWAAALNGTLSFGGGSNGAGDRCCTIDIDVDSNSLFEALNFGLMAQGEARKGKFGVYADFIYLSLTDESSVISEIDVSGVPPLLDPTIAAGATTDIKGTLIDLSAGYEFVRNERWAVSSTAGLRHLYIDATADYTLTGDLIQGQNFLSRAGRFSNKKHMVDGVFGLRGHLFLDGSWSFPFQADVGTGSSDLTWQAQAGVNYDFSWGGLFAGYRHLQYNLDSATLIDDLSVFGPYAGARFRF